MAVAISYPLGWSVTSFAPGEDHGLMLSGIGDVRMCMLSDVTVTLPQGSDEQPFDQVLAWGLWGQFEDRVDIDGLHPSVAHREVGDALAEGAALTATAKVAVGAAPMAGSGSTAAGRRTGE